MKAKPVIFFSTLVIIAVAWFVLIPRPAQTQGGYELTRSSLSGGGMSASGGAYQLSATIGQADAGQVSGGDYTLGGGFWGGGAVAQSQGLAKVYLPLVIK